MRLTKEKGRKINDRDEKAVFQGWNSLFSEI